MCNTSHLLDMSCRKSCGADGDKETCCNEQCKKNEVKETCCNEQCKKNEVKDMSCRKSCGADSDKETCCNEQCKKNEVKDPCCECNCMNQNCEELIKKIESKQKDSKYKMNCFNPACAELKNDIMEIRRDCKFFKTKEIPRKQQIRLIANSSWVGERTTGNQDADVEVILPAELSERAEEQQNDLSRLIFIVFNESKLFQDENNSTLLNQQVFGIIVGNTSIQNLTEGVTIKVNHGNTVKNGSHRCVFLFENENKNISWNSTGCKTTVEANQTICVCDHLTFFAVLLDLRLDSNTLDEKDVISLTYITMIGCAISAVFSALTVFLYCVMRKNKGDHTTQIHINLCIAYFLLNTSFLTNEWIRKLMADGLCKTIAVFLHYSLLCTLTWMAIEGFHLYLMLIKVFNIYVKYYIQKLVLLGWGIPAVVVSLCIAVDKNNYGQIQIKTQDNNSSFSMCWITNDKVHYVTNCGFLGTIWLWNLTMLITVCVKLAQMRKGINSVSRSVWKDLWMVLGLSFLLSITWALTFISYGPVYVIQAYLSCILNSLQGFFIFLWYYTIKQPPKEQTTNYTSAK
ncbi:adhesion G-protein coupled receptor G5-like isoform X2 [Mobula birostris]|uniref:adhesion G-protein coupled receptor G5-like isoform X2 n=1 Tax=Mobula birostris TaxID=1983395 RepID=UPI003B288F90